MRKGYRYAALTLLAAVLIFMAWLVLRPAEPLYQGKPIDYWTERVGQEVPDADFFPQVDARAIPYLVRALHRRSGPWPEYYNQFRSHMPRLIHRHMRAALPVTDWKVRANAAQALGTVGEHSSQAIAELIYTIQNDEVNIVRLDAVESLQNIAAGNAAAAKAVIGALKDKAPEVRDAAGDALWKIDPTTAKKIL